MQRFVQGVLLFSGLYMVVRGVIVFDGMAVGGGVALMWYGSRL
jgi:hypothetical protein